jgi:hypothetical protein
MAGGLSASTSREIDSQSGKEFRDKFRKIAQLEFEIIKNRMMEEFEEHKITLEIEEGPLGSNSSGTLGGYGNLWSFIGFPDGYDPLDGIREKLDETEIRDFGFRRGTMNLVTTEPSREELFAITKMSDFRKDFEGGRSWLDGIETGLSGLGLYLHDEEKDFGTESRSGTAIQLKGGKRSSKAFGEGDTGGATGPQRSRFKRTPYVSAILKKFKNSILRLNRSVIK